MLSIIPETLLLFKNNTSTCYNCRVFNIDVFHGFWFSEYGTNQYASFRTDLKYTVINNTQPKKKST